MEETIERTVISTANPPDYQADQNGSLHFDMQTMKGPCTLNNVKDWFINRLVLMAAPIST